MRLIRQRRKNDCGVACVAMLAGVSYARALAVAPYYPKDGLTVGVLMKMLKKLTGKRTTYFSKRYRTIRCYRSKKQLKILRIVHPDKDKGHFIVTDGVRFYDPSEKQPILISRAKRLAKWTSWKSAEEITFV